MDHIEYTIPADIAQVKTLRQTISRAFSRLNMTASLSSQLQLAVTEWATNVIHYSQPKASRIQLVIMPQIVLIKDDGGYFTDFEQYNATEDPLFNESGHGLWLIKKLFPSVRYQPQTLSQPQNQLIIPLNIKDINQKPIVAIIISDTAYQLAVQKLLNTHYEVQAYQNAKLFLASLAQQKPNLILAATYLSDMDGFALRAKLLQKTDTELIPFVFLSNQPEDNLLVEQAIHLSIDDYVAQSDALAKLPMIVGRILMRHARNRVCYGNLLLPKITASLKPEIPGHLAGFKLEVLSRTASAGGGDFIVLDANSKTPTLILGDVMGHDIPAKFFAHSYAGYLRGLLQSLDLTVPLSQLLTVLSHWVWADRYLADQWMTCLVMRLLPQGEIELASAGHPSPLLIQQNEIRTQVVPSGPLLGLSDASIYSVAQISLRPTATRLLVYSDGLTHLATSHATQLLKNNLQTTLDLPLSVAMQTFAQQFDAVSSTPAQDDVTAILLEFKE